MTSFSSIEQQPIGFTSHSICAICGTNGGDEFGKQTLVFDKGQYVHPACQPDFDPRKIAVATKPVQFQSVTPVCGGCGEITPNSFFAEAAWTRQDGVWRCPSCQISPRKLKAGTGFWEARTDNATNLFWAIEDHPDFGIVDVQGPYATEPDDELLKKLAQNQHKFAPLALLEWADEKWGAVSVAREAERAADWCEQRGY